MPQILSIPSLSKTSLTCPKMKGGDQFITSIQNVVMNLLGVLRWWFWVYLLLQCDWKWRTLCVGMPSNAPFTSPLERGLLPCFYEKLALLIPPWCRSNPTSFLAPMTSKLIAFQSGGDMSSICMQWKIDGLNKGLLPISNYSSRLSTNLITMLILYVIYHRPLHSITLESSPFDIISIYL